MCYRLGTMFYLEVKNDKETMKKQKFEWNIGGMDYCTKIIIKANKRSIQMSPNKNFFANS